MPYKDYSRTKEQAKNWVKNNPKKVKLLHQKYYKNGGKEKMLQTSLKRKYGLTLKQYNEMGLKQAGLCAICGQPETRKSRWGGTTSLSVDHNHKTKRNRGLLCFECNTAIGKLKVDEFGIMLLIKAIDYIRGLK